MLEIVSSSEDFYESEDETENRTDFSVDIPAVEQGDETSSDFVREQRIRAIVHDCAAGSCSAKDLHINAMGLMRTLGCLAHALAIHSQDQSTRAQAIQLVTVAQSTETILNGISCLPILETAGFYGVEAPDSDDYNEDGND